jgi:hypothetical protein
MQKTDGALTATVGTAIGSVALGAAGASLMLLPCKSEGLECLGPVIAGVFAAMGGFILGSLIGCYVALDQRMHNQAGATVLVLMGLGAGAGFGALGLALLGLPSKLFIPLALAAWLGLPYLARWVVVEGWRRVRSRRSEAPVEI